MYAQINSNAIHKEQNGHLPLKRYNLKKKASVNRTDSFALRFGIEIELMIRLDFFNGFEISSFFYNIVPWVD